MSEEKKRLLSGWDKLWLLIVVVIIMYFVLQKMGVDFFYQTETEEMIHQPHQDFRE
jgi:hypothetical protein